MAKKQTSKNIVQPIVRELNKKHVLEEMFSKDQSPMLTSVGCARVPDTDRWVSFVIKSKGREVLAIEVDEPDFRQIAEDNAKTSFVTQIMDPEL